jgi:predicted metalloprotease
LKDMDWTPGGTSNDIEDRRDSSGGGGGGFGGFGGFGGGGGGFGGIHLGIGGTILLLVISYFFHTNLFSIFSGGGSAPSSAVAPVEQGQPNTAQDTAEAPEVQFVSYVLDDVQKTWSTILPQQAGDRYRHAKLVLYRDQTNAGCGTAQSATGPFYCPEDEKVYLDLGFFQELKSRFGAPGEFAQAYVIAHELGHHIQKLVGTQEKVQAAEQQDRGRANQYSVKLELQADCYAGVWGHTSQQRGIVHEQDITQGMAAAASVGDDRLQRMARGSVNPETFTHGSSAQRTAWFKRGLDSGNMSDCDTFR